MTLPPVDIDSLPLLDTAVGLFGSVSGAHLNTGSSLFEIIVTLVLIITD